VFVFVFVFVFVIVPGGDHRHRDRADRRRIGRRSSTRSTTWRMLPAVTGGRGRKENSHDASFLSDLGINWDQSSRFQKIAQVPDEQFEEWICDCRAVGDELTQAAAAPPYTHNVRNQPGKPG
jgi:hypothetical protein